MLPTRWVGDAYTWASGAWANCWSGILMNSRPIMPIAVFRWRESMAEISWDSTECDGRVRNLWLADRRSSTARTCWQACAFIRRLGRYGKRLQRRQKEDVTCVCNVESYIESSSTDASLPVNSICILGFTRHYVAVWTPPRLSPLNTTSTLASVARKQVCVALVSPPLCLHPRSRDGTACGHRFN